MISLYIVFPIYFDNIFTKFKNLPTHFTALLGGLGGAGAYYSAILISEATLSQPLHIPLTIIGICWSIYFSLAIRWTYSSKNPWDSLLDYSIIFSFDRSGYHRRAKQWTKPLRFKPDGIALITGGTSGIGLALAKLLSENNVKCVVTGRSEQKGNSAKSKLKQCNFLKLDMADWGAIKTKIMSLNGNISYLILNAGGMPTQFTTNSFGVENQIASQVFGHIYLLRSLVEAKKLNPNAKVVFVSSGGMYLRTLSLDSVFEDKNYDKIATYANVKRAQVELLPLLAKSFPFLSINGMHPGWVKTPGLEESLVAFSKIVGSRLRSPKEGADTIAWLLSEDAPNTSGEFYFDREKTRTHIPFLANKANQINAEKLMTVLNDYWKRLPKEF